ncbi:DNA-binding transcriptional LysR family regulator [Saccharothrix coeruleofusca]|uniref:LysR family transcriptional regulator n=1 Tax=Saccharothrix coeruleofusca TaxID=33919 RepID=UPI001AE88D75|nr:LysR family transcriptional regulator [Saccharothrix coeruleofusca]MBP2335043.1 DNA-binding transcriptional LysR family regulator [Saccharothrix coeruleofusca]
MDLLRHLRHFAVVAQELHFGRAAEVLGIAQPPLSQSVQRLERELGVELFDRSRRRVRLTPAGALLLDQARGLLAAEQRMRTLARLVREGALGVLRAGVPPETPAVVLQALLRALTEQLPGLDVDLQELTTGEQLRALADARLDIGLVHHPVEAPDLRFGPVVRTRLGVLLPRASPLARRAELAPADLAGHDLVLPPRPTAPGWHDHVLDVCGRHGFTPARVRHARDTEFLLGLVLAGQGVAFEPESTARREARVVWRPLTGHPLHRSTSAAWPAQSPHPAAERFAAIAAATLEERAPQPMSVPQADQDRPWSVVYAPHPADAGW